MFAPGVCRLGCAVVCMRFLWCGFFFLKIFACGLIFCYICTVRKGQCVPSAWHCGSRAFKWVLQIRMKRILYVLMVFVAIMGVGTLTNGYSILPPTEDGDTVAACEFEPEDTAAKAKAVRAAQTKQIAVTDSVGIYYIGDGSTRTHLQLVSYPSRRDTMVYGKTLHVRVKGSAAFGSIVRVQFYLLNGKDSLVRAVEELTL